MIQHAWSVLCSSSSIDSDTNNVSLFQVLEQLNIEGPFQAPGEIPISFELVSLWSRSNVQEPTSGESRSSVLAPNGKRSTPQLTTLDLQQFKRIRSRLQLASLPVVAPGLYWFVVELRQQGENNWVEVARVPLEVILGVPKAE